MIVKVPKSRRDGNTSFQKLHDYMVGKLTDLDSDTRKASFENLTQYITTEEALNGMGDQVEKCIAVEIGNLTSLKTAPIEMWAVSQRNTRCKDPVYHYILSWPEHERPPIPDIMIAARNSLAALGLQEHQYIVAIHANTDNIHAHIEVNKVHPKTYKSRHLEWSHKTLHKAARETEIQFGWSHDNGLWQVVDAGGKKLIVENSKFVDEDMPGLSSKAKDFELWTGTESLESWCKREPATALKEVLKNKPTSWQQIHHVLGEYGIELKDSGAGGLKVQAKNPDGQDKNVSLAASKAFRFLKRKELEKSLGNFVAADPEAAIPMPIKSYKRDPIKRLIRREERKAQRDALFQQFSEEKEIILARQHAMRANLKRKAKEVNDARLNELKQSYMSKREELRKDTSLSGIHKQQAYMLLKFTYQNARGELLDQIEAERKAINEVMPKIKSWRAWVEEKAQAGNEVAISALRGMVYQDKRKSKKEGERGDEEEDNVVAIRPSQERPEDSPTIRPLQKLYSHVSTNGRVFYRFRLTNKLAFIDEGRRLTFGRTEVSDEALLSTLRYAQTKWGNTLHIAGGDGIFRERLVRLASSLDMVVDNNELQGLQNQLLQSKGRSSRNVQVKDSQKSTIRNIPLVAELARDNPDARVFPATAQNKTYRGKIESLDNTHAIQHLGNDRYVVHNLASLDQSPSIGANLEIKYKAGAGKVSEATRSKGRQ
jgi:hypothetical protein